MKVTKQKVIAEVARLTMGGIFLTSGTNSFFNYLSLPAPGGAGLEFIQAMKDTGYLYWTVKTLECALGTLLVANLFVPLCLVVAAPLIFNIFCYGFFLDSNALTVSLPLILLSTEFYLLWYYRKLFTLFFKYQLFTDPVRDDLAHLVILEELEEKSPKAYINVLKMQREDKLVEKGSEGSTGL